MLKYWLKVVAKRKNKSVSLMYKLILKDINNDDRTRNIGFIS